MTVDQVFIIRKLQNLEEMFVVYSAVTRMPFATCDEETYNDQVWIFTEQDKVQEFAKSYTEKKILLMGVKVKKEEAPMFYMNLFAMGINEIVFQDGDHQHKLELTSVVKIPDYNKLPERQRPILNPQLQLSAIYFLQELRKPDVEPDKEVLKELEEEMLQKINALGIGPGGLGGTITALAVNINTYPTHIAGLPVAINICCHVNRHAVREL